MVFPYPQLIRVTSGTLNPQKCCGTIYTWSPDKFGILCISTPSPFTTAIMPNLQQPQDQIQILQPSDGTCYLGIYVATYGSSKPMENHLWKKAVLYSKVFQWMHMSCLKVGILYQSCFIPANKYPFPTTWLPLLFLECNHQLSPSTILNKMGYHCNLPRSMVFVPWDMGGVGLCHLYYKHGTQQVIILLCHLQVCIPLGTTLEVLIHTYQ